MLIDLDFYNEFFLIKESTNIPIHKYLICIKQFTYCDILSFISATDN